MSDKMQPIPFRNLLRWIVSEYTLQKTIFEIPSEKFHFHKINGNGNIFGEQLDSPIGPAAGPHTQLAQNIVSAYLTGGRFFELKTVQKLDELKIDKPCIDATDEGYNVEWSQELLLDQSYAEYVKGWFLLHLLKDLLGLSYSEKGFVFNMSVGYDLEGIKTERMNQFIEEMKDASADELFAIYKAEMISFLSSQETKDLLLKGFFIAENKLEQILHNMENISSNISDSVTLSTMHGCPPDEIEAIAKYLIEEKSLHTFVKLNPTLLGFEYVNEALRTLGYNYIELDRNSFDHDLKFEDAVPMLKRLMQVAEENKKVFGIKLSNTLGVKNTKKSLPGSDIYMSGRSLFPLTINLANKLATKFEGKINISFSGGANIENVIEILSTGIKPVTFVTDLLKPSGYFRLAQISETVAANNSKVEQSNHINLSMLKALAENSLSDKKYFKEKREIDSIKIQKSLPAFDCYVAPCQEACPIHQDVASYIKLVEQKRYEEAYELIVSKNPLPHITGYICDHQCQYHCTRWDYDEPVMIREIKKEAALNGYESYLNKFHTDFLERQNGIRVAVIGAGPSGLSAAYFLMRAGFDVTVFEKEMSAGGIVQNILPQFRLPQEAIEKDIAFIEKHGVRFIFGCDANLQFDKLKKEGFQYIYVAIGAPLSNKLPLEGIHENVFGAIEFLKDYHNAQLISLCKTVAVVGGGNSAMDSARAAARYQGVEKVYLIYRRTKEQMPADKEEFYAALNDGVEFKELLLPVKFQDGTLQCQKMKLDQIGKDGRREVVPVENEFIELQVDSVITAIGEHVDKEYLHRNKIRVAHNKAVVNESNETEVKNVFIGGDALRGPSTVVESIADGKKVAEEIIKREFPDRPKQPIKNYFVDNPALFEDIRKRKGVISNQNSSEILLEAGRCLGCNFICNKCVDVCPNRANVAIESSGEMFKDKFQILHLDDLCNECGNCETFCPYQGKPYKDKPTLFSDEESFGNSRNNGFFITQSKNQTTAFVRWKSERGSITFDENGEVTKSSYFEQTEIATLTKWIVHIKKQYPYLLHID